MVVVDRLGVPALPVQQHELDRQKEGSSDQHVRAHPYPAQRHQGEEQECGQAQEEGTDEDAVCRRRELESCPVVGLVSCRTPGALAKPVTQFESDVAVESDAAARGIPGGRISQ